MFCPSCNQTLRMGKLKIVPKNDNTRFKKTEIYNEIPVICINKDCVLYGGEDLDNPTKLVDTVKNRIY